MACNGCNDGCFDEAVQLQSGPAGQDGLSAYEIAVEGGYSDTEANWLLSLNGTDGVDGGYILFQSTDILSPTTLGTSYTDVVGASGTSIPLTGVENVGDQFRVEMTIIGDGVGADDAGVTYRMKLMFGTLTVYNDYIVGISKERNAMKLVFDLVVTATDTLTLRTFYEESMVGFRAVQAVLSDNGGVSNGLQHVTSTVISPTLANTNYLEVQFKKNTTGLGTEQCSITSMTIYKMLKEQ